MVVTPYIDQNPNNDKFTRIFQETVDSDDLVWHRDHSDRIITILEGTNWKLQYDNVLPILLEIGQQYYIPKNDYHRVIKGDTPLIIEIHEI